MPIETALFIGQLESTYPEPSDASSTADDHLRLIKKVLKAQFPGSTGTGLTGVVDLTETEFNNLTGTTNNVQAQLEGLGDSITASVAALDADLQAQIDALAASIPDPPFASGTKMLFVQETAPVGWTQFVTLDDYMIRVVNSVGGGTGGSDSPIVNDKVIAHTHTAAANASFAGIHNHTVTGSVTTADFLYQIGPGDIEDMKGTPVKSIGNTSEQGAHTHTITVNISSTGETSWTPKYINTIIATKD